MKAARHPFQILNQLAPSAILHPGAAVGVLGKPSRAMSSLQSLLGDRKAMEAERKARAEAKKRSNSSVGNDPSRDSKKIKRSVSPPPTSIAKTPANPATLQYPEGRLFKTWTLGYERTPHDIKIEEVLRRRDLNIAVLSSWQIDNPWLMSKLDIDRTKVLLVHGAKEPQYELKHRKFFADHGLESNFRTVYPPRVNNGQFQCMHSKLMLLFYDNSLRIAVPSANLMAFDWGESGDMENSVFVIDLPRLPENKHGDANPSLRVPFARELIAFVQAQKLNESTKDNRQTVCYGLSKFDFTKTSNVAFIHAIGQTLMGPDKIKATGLNQLAESVRNLGLESKVGDPMQVDFSASSIGTLTMDKLECMFQALRGFDQPVPTGSRSTRGTAGQSTLTASQKPPSEILPIELRFRVHYPSVQYVENSKGGPGSAGTQFMCQGWTKDSFPLVALHDFSSKRRGCMSHNKFIVVRTAKSAYVYSGSANFSQAAWGNLTFDRAAKQPKITCANWECGVLVKVWPPPGAQPLDPDDVSTCSEETDDGDEPAAVARPDTPSLDHDGVLPISVFDGKIDIPFHIPDRSYVEHNLKPWIN